MDNLDSIKARVERLFKESPEIHITIKLTRPKVNVDHAPAVITGVYRNIFQIEEREGGLTTRHSLQYTDILIGKVKIAELE